MTEIKKNGWMASIPWYLTVMCTLSLVLIGFYLYQSIEWFKNSATNNPRMMDQELYRIFLYNTYLALLKRSLGIITGIAIVFIGMGVSFYAMKKSTSLEVKGFAQLATVSPGIIAICLGCFLIVKSIESKDTIKYGDPASSSQSATDNTLSTNPAPADSILTQ